jgi:XRE family transcriptional regulator of biofilm formation
MPEDCHRFAHEVMRSTRLRRGWTQQDVAEMAGLALSEVGLLDRGVTPNPLLSTVARVAHVLSVPVDSLIHREDDQ